MENCGESRGFGYIYIQINNFLEYYKIKMYINNER